VVSIHVSSRISGTFNSATLAKKMLGATIPVNVIDSKFNSAGLGLVVKAAAEVAKNGASAREVEAAACQAINHVQMFGMFETMKYLARSGRLNHTIAMAASLISVKPLLTFNQGEIVRAGFVRTVARGLDRIYEFVKARTPVKEITIVHSDIPEQAVKLKERLADLVQCEKISITELGAALGVHGGPGVLALALRT
jgi:DegV family protein with EDD domain